MTASLSLAASCPAPHADPRKVVVSIEGLNKHYGAYHVLRDINLNVREGERIALSGQLVRVEGDDGFRWVSSLSREDTGAGACELIWVEQLSRLD
mgnify:CR=1 FL=1